jgi:3-methylcrotonyl-CoA carboxylase alpha subunit
MGNPGELEAVSVGKIFEAKPKQPCQGADDTAMEYRLQIGENIGTVHVDGSAEDSEFRVTVDGEDHSVHCERPSVNHYHLLVDGRAVHVFVAGAGHDKHICINGRIYHVKDADEISSGRKRRGFRQEEPTDVTPPTPSIVVRILVEEGDIVKKGQSLVVVSAMKMETTLKAPRDGTVKKINARVDDKVMPGDILVEIEEEVAGDE